MRLMNRRTVWPAVLAIAVFLAPATLGADDRIIREVRHELLLLPWLSVFDNLQFKVEGSKVTLLGQVVRPSIKPDAERAVKRIEDVTFVDNQIEVLPASFQDDQLRIVAYRTIYGYPVLRRYAINSIPPIRLIIKNGHLTVEGVVATQGDKNIVNIVANTIPGLFSVTNHLQVEEAPGADELQKRMGEVEKRKKK